MELDVPYKGIKLYSSPDKLNELREKIKDYLDILNLPGLPIERFGDQRISREASIIMDSIHVTTPKREVTVPIMKFGERNRNGRSYFNKTIPYNVLSTKGKRKMELYLVDCIPSFTVNR